MWSISASVSSTPATGAARTPSARSPASPSSCWRRSGEALARSHGPSVAADRDRRLRARRRRARAGRLAGRAAAVPLREAAAGGGAEDMNAHRPMIETGDDLRTPAPVDPRRAHERRGHRRRRRPRSRPTPSRSSRAACSSASSTRCSRGGWRARRRTPTRSRSSRSAASCARGGSSWSRRTGVDPEDLRTAAARARARHRGGRRRVAWALDDTLPMAEKRQVQAIVEGAVLGSYDAGRWKSDAAAGPPSSASSSAGRATSSRRPRAGPRSSRAGRTSPASSSTRRRTSSGRPASPIAPPRSRASRVEVLDAAAAGLPALAAVGRSSAVPPRLVVLRHEPAGRAARARGSRSWARP